LLLTGEDGTALTTSEGTASSPLAGRIEQHLAPGRYYLQVSADGPGAYRLLTRFTGASSPLEPLDSGVSVTAVAAGDLNADGRPDLVCANSDSDSLSVLLGQSDGTFAPHSDITVALGPSALAVADFTGDGRPDLICAIYQNGILSVLPGRGDG